MSSGESRHIMAEGKFMRLVKVGRWEFAERCGVRGAVAIVAATDEGCLVLTEQFRVPLGKRVIELPAGLAGDLPGAEDEPLAEAARRELLEETGYDAASMTLLTAGPTSAGLTDEHVALFMASGLRRVSAGGGDANENIQVHVIPVPDVPAFLEQQRAAGRETDYKIFAALYFLQAAGQ